VFFKKLGNTNNFFFRSLSLVFQAKVAPMTRSLAHRVSRQKIAKIVRIVTKHGGFCASF